MHFELNLISTLAGDGSVFCFSSCTFNVKISIVSKSKFWTGWFVLGHDNKKNRNSHVPSLKLSPPSSFQQQYA